MIVLDVILVLVDGLKLIGLGISCHHRMTYHRLIHSLIRSLHRLLLRSPVSLVSPIWMTNLVIGCLSSFAYGWNCYDCRLFQH